MSVSPDSSAGSGRDHFAIEQVLDAFGRATVAIRPNPFMQNFLEGTQNGTSASPWQERLTRGAAPPTRG